MMKGFMKEKMRQRMHVHAKGDLTKLQEAVGLDILPKEYGGTNGTVQEHVGMRHLGLDFYRAIFPKDFNLWQFRIDILII